jgi:aminoglycoside phosphotransferase (APT) family kinase protein
MAGLSLTQRDLQETRQRLGDWFEHRFGDRVEVSELAPANPAGGYSSESLLLSIDDGQRSHDHIVRIPPSGGGIFADYDLEGQTKTQELLHRHGIPTPSPIHYEPSAEWIGSKFLVMPRIVGHTPADNEYAREGWLAEADADVRRRAHDSFLELLATIQNVPPTDAPWLRRETGIGNAAELDWWQQYVGWGTGRQVPGLLEDAFAWLREHQPTDPPQLSISWGDTRMGNCIFDDYGNVVGALDWEQACICPAEADLGWWLATRRQSREFMGMDSEPPGFDPRETVIVRYEAMLGRALVDLEWYEMFAMARMGSCIARVQVLLHRLGQTEHHIMAAPLLPAWVPQAMGI